MKYVIITHDCYPLPIAGHLMEEGNEVIVGVLEKLSDLNIPQVEDDELEEDKKERMSNYDGIIEKDTVKNVCIVNQVNCLKRALSKNQPLRSNLLNHYL